MLHGKDNAEFLLKSQSHSLRVPQPKGSSSAHSSASVFLLPHPSLLSFHQLIALHDALLHWDRPWYSSHYELDRPNNFSAPEIFPSHNPSSTRVPGPCRGRMPPSPIWKRLNISNIQPGTLPVSLAAVSGCRLTGIFIIFWP